MNERFKKLAIELSKKLEKMVLIFLVENIEGEEKVSDLINFILSAHLSALFNSMIFITEGNEESTEKVKKFIDDVREFLLTLDLISRMETIGNYK